MDGKRKSQKKTFTSENSVRKNVPSIFFSSPEGKIKQRQETNDEKKPLTKIVQQIVLLLQLDCLTATNFFFGRHRPTQVKVERKKTECECNEDTSQGTQ